MDDENWQDLPPSRSAKKREAKAIEDLARQLADKGEAGCDELPVDEEIKEEIRRAAHTAGRGSRKRQVKHLAGLLRRRQDDVEALILYLEGQHAEQLREKADFHALEQLRDRLCDPKRFEEALQEVREGYPMLDHRQVGRLARSVHNSGDKKAFREIFRRLREHQG